MVNWNTFGQVINIILAKLVAKIRIRRDYCRKQVAGNWLLYFELILSLGYFALCK